jgi:nitrite reductase/ring-hydroxylating ferredoxin subunit
MTGSEWVVVAKVADLREGDVTAARVDGHALALCLVGGLVYAVADRCTHGDARLSDGFVIDHCIECPLHQGQFDLRSGAPLCEPVTEPIRVYPTRLVDDRVEVSLGDPD